MQEDTVMSAEGNIIKEVTCPICLALLTEPLSLDCGHSFCQACIIAFNKQSEIYPGRDCSCPVCHQNYKPWNLWPNKHLANIVEKLREKNKSSPPRNLCEQHGESLQVFCKEDDKFICQLCVLSLEHQGHRMFFKEEVVKECQERLHTTLKKLRREQQEAEELEVEITEERAIWKNHIQVERQKITKGFSEMRKALDTEEQKELRKLEEEEVTMLDNLVAAKDQVSQQRQQIKEFILDLECHMQGSSMDTLQDMISIVRRSENYTLKKPKFVPKKMKSVFHVPDLSQMLQIFKDLTDVRNYWVDVTVNPLSASGNAVISTDQRQVTFVNTPILKNTHQCDFSAFDIFGCQYFSSGKHYWEVDVSAKTAWILGVYSQTNNLKRKKSSGFVFDPNASHTYVYNRYKPTCGYWVIGLQNQVEYNALVDSSTSNPKVLTLALSVPPCRVGVFLDYEAGSISFFNVTNHGSRIYQFTNCCFSEAAYPYFNSWGCPGPFILCPPIS